MRDWNRLKHILHGICRVLELVCAALMVAGILLSIVGMLRDGSMFRRLLWGEGPFIEYIERVFAIVIGIEFLEMLFKPSSDNVIQTLIFLVARHMIVNETTPVQDLISIVSIAILFILRRWLRASKSEPGGFALFWRKKEGKEE